MPDHELNPEHGPAREVVELLLGADVEFELLPHRRTLSAAGEARALAVPTERTAKTVVTRVADRRLAEADDVVLEAGAHELSIRLRPADLVRITAAEIADIATG